MLRWPFCLILPLFVLMFGSCRDDVPAGGGEDIGLQKGDTAVRTLVIYMMAENSLANYAASDIDEVKAGAVSVPSDCRLFVFVDDRSKPRILQFYNDNGVCAERLLHSFSNDFCSSDTAALGRVLDYLLDDYPTCALDLVLWSHGDGWLPDYARSAPMRTIGVDNGKDSYSDKTTKAIEAEELAALLSGLPVKVDRLMFDACFMQGVEVVYALRGAAEWIIASPAEIPGEGAPYETVVAAFFASDGVNGILDAYRAAYDGKSMGVVLSAVYAPAMQGLADAVYSTVSTYFNVDRKRDYSQILAYLPGGARGLYGFLPCFYDANAVMKWYLSGEEYVAWKEALDAAVPYTVTTGSWYSAYLNKALPVDTSVYCGISMYMPQTTSRNELMNVDFTATEWYSAAGWQNAGW